ncbi:hypothetical protein GRI62_08645 [Erythrobacter arachoides]|uniref:DUF3147 family protein n=1 Tax=Aurantiacibacter arachoides TaxID=1850444 RepID=A0A845A1U2_9SPHN|nr:DUF3147 family protein [Aurantiacibacter arachoides]MXO93674.1 hypothetical protein [Aurantiacibacter arachoides]GGD47550.1 hypothetical protein GCM10011411_04090 [Aurantiacibacter arachoides]
MLYLIIKAALSGILIAAASEVARRWPGIGALIVALPLVSVLAMIWLWRDTADVERIAVLSGSTFWFILPSLPMFVAIPWLLRNGVGFWGALALGCVLTTLLYLGMIWAGPRFGLKL